jgi:uncharacterized membrane protein
MRIFSEPEKKALFSLSFLAFRLAVKKFMPFEITSFTVSGVYGKYLNDLLPLIPQVSRRAFNTIAVLYIESSARFFPAKLPRN